MILRGKAELWDVKRAAAYYKVIRYSYSATTSSYGGRPVDISRGLGHMPAYQSGFFAVKILAIALSGSVPALFAAVLFQSVSFGLYTPAIVDYVNRTVPYKDSAKAHSLAVSMQTVGVIIATPASGLLLDMFTVKTVLAVLTLIAAVGAVVCLVAIRRNQNHPLNGWFEQAL